MASMSPVANAYVHESQYLVSLLDELEAGVALLTDKSYASATNRDSLKESGLEAEINIYNNPSKY